MPDERHFSPVEGDMTSEDAKAAEARAREEREAALGKDESGRYDIGDPEPYEDAVSEVEGEPKDNAA